MGLKFMTLEVNVKHYGFAIFCPVVCQAVAEFHLQAYFTQEWDLACSSQTLGHLYAVQFRK
jgi:hypothetical protein